MASRPAPARSTPPMSITDIGCILSPQPYPGLPAVGELHPADFEDMLQVTQRRTLRLLPLVLEAGDRCRREFGLLGEVSDRPVEQTAGRTAERWIEQGCHPPENARGRHLARFSATDSLNKFTL